jgi:dTDP-4-amino-4,6-dideoxygalactose transaminase
MIPYSKQNITNDDIKSVVKVLKSKILTQGKEVVKFEKNIAKFVGSKYSIAVSSASAALHLSCLALELKKK